MITMAEGIKLENMLLGGDKDAPVITLSSLGIPIAGPCIRSTVNLRVVQLAGLGQLPLSADGRADAPQMRQRRRIRQPV